ncbi:hypothetical protein BOTBODRAFT_111636, partial [Botryobasidium botryosum FD-172 SS1]
HIPRPRNAFILYRSSVVRDRILEGTEKDHRNISRIVAEMWKGLDPAEKAIWQQRADVEKEEHKKKYPNYRYAPSNDRAQVSPKKKPREKGVVDPRSHEIAQLVMQGLSGDALRREVHRMDGMAALPPHHSSTSTANRPSRRRSVSDPIPVSSLMRRAQAYNSPLAYSAASGSGSNYSTAPYYAPPTLGYPFPATHSDAYEVKQETKDENNMYSLLSPHQRPNEASEVTYPPFASTHRMAQLVSSWQS